MKIKLRTIIRLTLLLISVVSLVLVLKKPAPVAQRQTPAAIKANAESFNQKMDQFSQSSGTADLTPNSNVGSGAPTIKDQLVSFEGDVVHGQFLAEVAGKDVWVTISGHLGAKDGYATFDPTEFKVGDMSVPVSMVNPSLQKKLEEQRDRLKLPDYIGDLRVQGGELVISQK